ncbi:MAG: ribosome maturation factor RimP [Thermodesulfovibrionales bacterium]
MCVVIDIFRKLLFPEEWGFPLFFIDVMPRQEVINKLKMLAEEVAEDNDMELVDVELLGSGRKSILRVTIDREGGVGLDDCRKVSRQLEALLDVEDPIQGSYTLEVSSPGMDRPLKKIEDFVKYRGRKVKIVTKDKIDDQNYFVGTISEVHDCDIMIELKKKTISVPFDTIKKATLEIEF